MSLKEKIVAPFHEITGVLKDVGWWLGGIVAAVGLSKPYWNSLALNVTMHLFALLFLTYAMTRAVVYRRRNRRIYQSTKYIHSTIHDMRNTLCKELKYLDGIEDDLPDLPEDVLTAASISALHEVLQSILNSTSNCFSELTGNKCTAVLIMPEESEEHGKHFKSRLYSDSATTERIHAARPHRTGLVPIAFKSTSVICCFDLGEEMKKGNFDRRELDDPFKWYRSAMLCHFKVSGEPWGVLAVDSPRVKNFRPYYNELLCAFADCCGLAFILSEHGDLGNYVYQTS